MSELLPAWSEPFSEPGLRGSSLALPGVITEDWAYGDRSGSGVTVAVVDSGVDAGHPAVGGVDVFVDVIRDPETNEITFDESPHCDLYGHGTACAAIIRELAPEVRLVSVRVLGANLTGSAYNFAHGLDWCVEHDVDVINLSLSTTNETYLETFHDLIDQATHRGLMVVSAMNNERKVSIPSEFASVFSVACAPVEGRQHVMFSRQSPAQWGAAGIDVDVAWLANETMTATGNSFAAPVVAGLLARIAAAHPGIAPWEARTVLAALAIGHER